jgi:hypothetical protein
MTRLHTLTLCLLAGSLIGCPGSESGSVELRVSAVDGAIADTYAIDWDGDVTWTREIKCAVEETARGTSYTVEAIDRSQGELTVALFLQLYDGPGDYDRDEFQPTPLLAVDWADEATAQDWHLGTDSGGRCAITVNDGSRAGVVTCVDVGVFTDQVETADLAEVELSWSCGDVAREDFLNAMRSPREQDPSR